MGLANFIGLGVSPERAEAGDGNIFLNAKSAEENTILMHGQIMINIRIQSKSGLRPIGIKGERLVGDIMRGIRKRYLSARKKVIGIKIRIGRSTIRTTRKSGLVGPIP